MVGCSEYERKIIGNGKVIVAFFGDTIVKDADDKIVFDAAEIVQHVLNRHRDSRKKMEKGLINLTYGLFGMFQEIDCKITYVMFYLKDNQFHHSIIQIENEEGRTTTLVFSAKCPKYLAFDNAYDEFTIGKNSISHDQLFDETVEIHYLFSNQPDSSDMFGTARSKYPGFY